MTECFQPTHYSADSFQRGSEITSVYEGLHPPGRPKSLHVFNLVVRYNDKTRGPQIDVVGKTYDYSLVTAWIEKGVLPQERTHSYVPVLTRQHIFGDTPVAQIGETITPSILAAA